MAQIHELAPIAVDSDTWTPTPDAAKWQRIDDHGAATQDADYITAPNPSDSTKADTYFFSAPLADSSDRVVRVVLGVRMGCTPNVTAVVLRPRVKRGTTIVDLPTVALADLSGPNVLTWREVLVDVTSYRPDGGAWEVSDFGSGVGKVSLGLACTYTFGGAAIPLVSAAWLPVTTQPVGVLTAPVARAASSRAWRARRVPVVARVVVPSQYAGIDLGDEIYVSDTGGPAADGEGWPLDVRGARLLRVRALEEDLAAHTMALDGLVLRGQAVLYHDSGRTLGGARTPDGMTRLGAALTTHARGSKVYVEQPDGLVGEVLVDEQALDRWGRLLEGGAVNSLLWSAFQAGCEATWSLSGGASYATDEAFFEPPVLARVLNLPASATAVQVGGALQAAGWTVLSIDYRTLTGATAGVRVRRVSDGSYYDPATDTWGASVVTHSLAAAATTKRGVVRIYHAGSADTYRLTLVATGGAVRWYHVQSEAARYATHGWPSSRIVTRGAAGTRDHVAFSSSNDDGARTWPALEGVLRLRWRPPFSAADVVDSTRAFVLERVEYERDWAELRYVPASTSLDSTEAQLVYERNVSGDSWTVALPLAVVAGETYRIAVRWQPGEIAVWCESAIATAPGPDALEESSTATWWRGCSSSGDGGQAEGWLWDETTEPFALTDAELEDW